MPDAPTIRTEDAPAQPGDADFATVNATVVVPTETTDPVLAAAQSPTSAVTGSEPLATVTQVSTTIQVPGTALETVADKEANDVVRGEPVADTLPSPTRLYVDTQDPVANLRSRDNIVPSGPGSVEDFLPA